MHRRADWTGTKRLLWGTVCVYGWSSVLLNCLMFIQVFWPFLDRLGCPRSVFVPLVDYNKLIVLDKKRKETFRPSNEKWKMSVLRDYTGWTIPQATPVDNGRMFLPDFPGQKNWSEKASLKLLFPQTRGWGTVGGGGGKPSSSGLIPHQQQHHQNSVPISKPWFTWKETRNLQRNGH